MRTGSQLPDEFRSSRPDSLRRRRPRLQEYELASARTDERLPGRATSPDAVTGKIVSSLTSSGFCRQCNDAPAAFLFSRWQAVMSTKKTTTPSRPMPPAALLESTWLSFAPAPDVQRWIHQTFLAEQSRLFNEEHAHLEHAHFEVLWASTGFARQGRTVLGQCEQVSFRAGAWQKGRQEQQMRDWFGGVPDFLITIDAAYSAQCSDLEFCALVEHELYHIGQERDAFGAPAFTRSGMPKLTMRGHDVEEFVGVVRRYGASKDVQHLVDAAQRGPEVAKLDIARACGTCLLKLA